MGAIRPTFLASTKQHLGGPQRDKTLAAFALGVALGALMMAAITTHGHGGSGHALAHSAAFSKAGGAALSAAAAPRTSEQEGSGIANRRMQPGAAAEAVGDSAVAAADGSDAHGGAMSSSSSSSANSHMAAGSSVLDLTPVPFYFPPDASLFRKVAGSVTPVTDKIGALRQHANNKHSYDTLYSKYLEPDHRHLRRMKVLEIGLGCNMGYGPGASAHVWKQYLPNSEIWFGEYDQECINHYQDKIKQLGIHVLTGDQADNATLARWLKESSAETAPFDVIIDDGGHFNHQIFNSFAMLFPKALKPGGVYFIEDLRFSREPTWRGKPGTPIMAQVITDWLQSVLIATRYGTITDLFDRKGVMAATNDAYIKQQSLNNHGGEGAYLPTWKLPIGAKTVECAAEHCAIVKCTADDGLCPDGIARQPPDVL